MQTPEGRAKALKTMRERYGDDYFKRMGRLGGSSYHSKPRGFASDPEQARIAGRKGGAKSRRRRDGAYILPGSLDSETVRRIMWQAISQNRSLYKSIKSINADMFSASENNIVWVTEDVVREYVGWTVSPNSIIKQGVLRHGVDKPVVYWYRVICAHDIKNSNIHIILILNIGDTTYSLYWDITTESPARPGRAKEVECAEPELSTP